MQFFSRKKIFSLANPRGFFPIPHPRGIPGGSPRDPRGCQPYIVAIVRRKLADFSIFLQESEEKRSTATNRGLFVFSVASKTYVLVFFFVKRQDAFRPGDLFVFAN